MFLHMTLGVILSVHLLQCTSLAFAFEHPSPSPDILYGNVFLHTSQNESFLGQCLSGTVLYLDYSFTFNSVVVVCNVNHKAIVRTFPIDKSQSKMLSADQLYLKSLDEAGVSRFAFDWATGLLYFSEPSAIYVVDLKQNNCEELELYKCHEEATIRDLVVRPDNVSLVWMEELSDRMIFMQSSQAGKDVAQMFEKIHTKFACLTYDYSSKRFMTLLVKSRTFLEGYLFSDQVPSRKDHFNITKAIDYSAALLNDSVFYVDKDSQNLNMSIFKWNLLTAQSEPQPIVSKNTTFTFAVIGEHLRPKVNNRCENKQNVCSQNKDFCIPHNTTSFICKSNPLQVIANSSSKSAKWPIYVAVVFGLVLIAIVIIGWVVSKKKVRFYQIRLKSINRVNSSKLEAKTEATEEVAE